MDSDTPYMDFVSNAAQHSPKLDRAGTPYSTGHISDMQEDESDVPHAG